MHIIGIALLAVVLVFAGRGAYGHLTDTETKLGLLESAVQGVSAEMMRRSPALQANFDRFRACMKRRGCDTEQIFAERDRIIAQIWPETFDRVSVRRDWQSFFDFGGGKVSAKEVDEAAFFRELETYGKDVLRNQCVPVTAYFYSGGVATYDTNGFKCPGKPERKRSG